MFIFTQTQQLQQSKANQMQFQQALQESEERVQQMKKQMKKQMMQQHTDTEHKKIVSEMERKRGKQNIQEIQLQMSQLSSNNMTLRGQIRMMKGQMQKCERKWNMMMQMKNKSVGKKGKFVEVDGGLK